MKKLFFTLLVFIFFHNAIARVLVAPALKVGQNKWGYINEKGSYVLPPRYNFCFNFSECGLAGIYDNLNDKSHFINIYGDTIISNNEEYELIMLENSVNMIGFMDSALVVKKNEFYGAINSLGEIIVPVQYDSISVFNGGFAIGLKDSAYYIIDKKNNTTRVDLENLKHVNTFHNGLASFKTDKNLYGFINTKGEVTIEPKFIMVGIFEEGLTYAKIKEPYFGYINTKGEWEIEPRLYNAFNFTKGSYYAPAIINKGEEYSYISKTGQRFELPENIRVNYPLGFNDGIAIVKNETFKCGAINIFGQCTVMPYFKRIWSFKNGYAVAQKQNFLGLIDEYGNWSAQPQYTSIGELVSVTY